MEEEEDVVGGGEKSERAARARRRDALPEPYWRWLAAQLPAMAAASKANKQPTRWYADRTDLGGGDGKKQLVKGWFTLQWTMDNVPVIPDGLW
jgi:hypothetical protein